MPNNYENIFNDSKLIEDFEEFMEDEELEIYLDRHFEKNVNNFISEHYWSDLNKYFMNPENTNDILLLMYIKNGCDDAYGEIQEYIDREKNINYIRQKLYNYVITCKLQDLLMKKYKNKPLKTTYENLHTHLKYEDILCSLICLSALNKQINTFEIYDNGNDNEEGALTITWDYKFDEEGKQINKELNDLMTNEHHYKVENRKANFKWLEKIKDKCNYEIGEEIYILTKSNSSGYFNCYYSKNKKNDSYDMYIDKRGLINVKQFVYPFRNYEAYESKYNEGGMLSYFVRPTCEYNDYMYEK